MQNEKIEFTVARIFKEKLAQLKKGNQLGLEFYLFFEDGFCMIPENTKLERDHNYLIMSMLINRAKPSHYAVVSDTNVRDYHTMAIMFEQLMASITAADGTTRTMLQPYDRLPNGKIKLTRPRVAMDGAQMSGIAVSLFDDLGANIPDAPEKTQFLEMFEQELLSEKRPYQDANPG